MHSLYYTTVWASATTSVSRISEHFLQKEIRLRCFAINQEKIKKISTLKEIRDLITKKNLWNWISISVLSFYQKNATLKNIQKTSDVIPGKSLCQIALYNGQSWIKTPSVPLTHQPSSWCAEFLVVVRKWKGRHNLQPTKGCLAALQSESSCQHLQPVNDSAWSLLVPRITVSCQTFNLHFTSF